MSYYRTRRRLRVRTGNSGKLSGLKIFLMGRGMKYLFFGLIGFLIFGFFYALWVSRDLPTPGKLTNPDLKDSTRILDKDGDLLFSFYKDINRIYVNLDDIPQDLREATIAVEDKDFYTNRGFSLTGYIRGLIIDPIFRGRIAGGSTITQQLVKNALLSPERTITRKLKELILAVQVDSRFSKDEILEMYLNNIPYGGSAVGVEAASNLYFEKNAKDLTLAESAFLAGLPQAPSLYSPVVSGGDAYIDRSAVVLRRMREDGYISKDEEKKVLDEIKDFTFEEKTGSINAPHFVMYVRNLLIEQFGENLVENGNLVITTTLDSDIQKKTEEVITREFEKFENYDVNNASSVVLDVETGGILAMVGSVDYFDTENDGNYNATTALRQPGSSLKPITYAVAFEKGYTPATLLMDVKTDFYAGDTGEPDYKPVNYDGEYRGPVQLRFALGNSLNIPAVKLLAMVGIEPVMSKGYEMGITNWEPTRGNMANVGLSLVLGGREATLLDITSAYSVFARKGEKLDPYAIIEVRDKNGKSIYKHNPQSPRRVLSEDVAFLISHILLDNNARLDAFGPNSFLNIAGRTVAAKTGTTDQKKDNWTIGYTPSYVVGVWVGNNDNTPLDPRIASGSTGASPIWAGIMKAVLSGKENEDFEVPENVEAMQVDAFSGGLPIDGQPTRVEYFIKGTQPSSKSPIYKTVKMSKHDSGKLASDQEVEKNDYDTKEFIVFDEQDPLSTDDRNRWKEAIDAWIREHYAADRPEFYPPTEKSEYKYD